ncbi:hypothetical protein C474_15939 [Halogeometricum pallidum JCM 14848]|uniref:Uncharacterized protein n=1 Tax=Halogeometricum pallidum JCM 14848 TaxID=1227487 RepID=M0D032_HALPD|nr:hypothetical protein [Halogeometricum pallidum]ELZ28007.1 hypothetical protein C474_15939 [Halogeometricum pallidum JCM 14848]
MNSQLTTLRELEQGQFVRLTLDNGADIEGRAAQSGESNDECFRLELSTDRGESYDRCQVRTRVIDGAWTPITVRGYRSGDDDWVELGAVANVAPLERRRQMGPDDTGTRPRTGSDA